MTAFIGATAKGDVQQARPGYEAIFACRPAAVRHDSGHEHGLDPLRAPVQGGLRVMAPPFLQRRNRRVGRVVPEVGPELAVARGRVQGLAAGLHRDLADRARRAAHPRLRRRQSQPQLRLPHRHAVADQSRKTRVSAPRSLGTLWLMGG